MRRVHPAWACTILFAALVAACGGSSTTSTPSTAPVGTTGPTASTGLLDGKSYEVTLDVPGEKPEKDTLNFADGKFESTACTGFGFPKWSQYAATTEGEKTTFHLITKHPDGTTVDWTGTVAGDNVEGTAVRTMNGKAASGRFKGAIRPSP
jgi:hypothetical protein